MNNYIGLHDIDVNKNVSVNNNGAALSFECGIMKSLKSDYNCNSTHSNNGNMAVISPI